LAKISLPVDLSNIPRKLIRKMLEFVQEYRGVSAIQFGVPTRIIAIRYGTESIVMVNPKVESTKGQVKMGETCLSCPDMRAIVIRPTDIEVSYYTENLEYVTKWFTLPYARVIAHEMDHLNGISLYNIGGYNTA
jgi:peptide deformylase